MRALVLPVVALSLIAAPGSAAQIKASELGLITQTVDGTTIKFEYSRPRARGRDPLFGGVVHWGEVWTPGANWATTLEVDRDVTLNGVLVPEGKYSMWMIVEPEDTWRVVLDRQSRRFHTQRPDSSENQIWLEAPVEETAFTEVLTFDFADVSSTGTTAVLKWGTTAVPLDFHVTPTRPTRIESGQARRYTGDYSMAFETNAAIHDNVDFTVYYENGILKATWDPVPFEDWWSDMFLLRVEEDWFNPGWVEDGELYDVTLDLTWEFDVDGGRATGFTVRDQRDRVFATGTRKN